MWVPRSVAHNIVAEDSAPLPAAARVHTVAVPVAARTGLAADNLQVLAQSPHPRFARLARIARLQLGPFVP